MHFESKYEIGQIVFRVTDKIIQTKIYNIGIEHTENKTIKKYYVDGYDYYILEEKLYATKEEAANEWLKNQGLNCGLKN